MSLPMIEPVRLEGDRVALEPIRADLADELWIAAQDPEIWHWTTHLNHSREFFDGWVAGGIEGWESGERSTFVTSLRSAGSDRQPARVVGSSYLFYRPDEDVVEIGSTWLNPGAWGTGANTEAKLLMMTHAFRRSAAFGSSSRPTVATIAREPRSRPCRHAVRGDPAQAHESIQGWPARFRLLQRDR